MAEVKELADQMKNARFGVVFFGLGLTQSDGRHMNIDAAVGLVAANGYSSELDLPQQHRYILPTR